MNTVAAVIPCYNAERYLAEAIESAVRQTRPLHEIIVVDDGSTDGSLALARSFGNRVRTIALSRSGPAAARNAGIRAASSELIALLDADDVWSPTKTELQVPRFDDPAVGLVYGRMVSTSTEGVPTGTPRPPTLTTGLVFDKLYFRNFVPHSSVVVRRSVVMALDCYDETLREAQDFDLWLRLSQAWIFDAVPDTVTYYREHPGQITRRIPWKQMESAYLVQERYASLFEKLTGIASADRRSRMLAWMVEDTEVRYWRRQVKAASRMARAIEKAFPDLDDATKRRLQKIRRLGIVPEWVFRLRDRIGQAAVTE